MNPNSSDTRNSDFIPEKELEKGIELILQNVKSLLDSASSLHENNRFLHSTVFSIFAMEELGKLELLKDYRNKRQNLPIQEWDRLATWRAAHKQKLRKYVMTERVESVSKLPDEIVDLLARYHASFKNRVLYVNWNKRSKKWAWYPEEYSGQTQEEMSTRLLKGVRKRYENVR
jgi:AbiV family abortive infection protein